MKSDYKIYNVLLPIWLLIFFPSWLWLLLIPANYLIDRIVLCWTLGDMLEKGQFCRKHNWKICIAGFVGDFTGALLLFALTQLIYGVDDNVNSFISKAADGAMFNPFSNVLSLFL